MSNFFDEVETDYNKHEKAKSITLTRFERLEKSRNYFWKIVGYPPEIKKLLYSPWSLTFGAVVLTGIYMFIASFAQAIVMVGFGIILIAFIGMAKVQNNSLGYMLKREASKLRWNRYKEKSD